MLWKQTLGTWCLFTENHCNEVIFLRNTVHAYVFARMGAHGMMSPSTQHLKAMTRDELHKKARNKISFG